VAALRARLIGLAAALRLLAHALVQNTAVVAFCGGVNHPGAFTVREEP